MQETLLRIEETVVRLEQSFAEVRPTHFPGAQDIFVTFLYAAAAHLTISHLVENPSKPLAWSSLFITLFFLIFLASDWLSHVRIRSQIAEAFSLSTTLAKFVLELITVFLLAVVAVLLIHEWTSESSIKSSPFSGTAIIIFGLFGIVSQCWNWVIIFVMKNLSLKALLRAAWFGERSMFGGMSQYAEAFVKWAETHEQHLKAQIGAGMDASSVGQTSRAAWQAIWYRIKRGAFIGIIALYAEFAAFHVGIANGLIGLSLLVTQIGRNGMPLLYINAPLKIALVLLLFSAVFFSFSKELISRSRLGAVFFLASAALIYVGLRPWALIIVLLLQQLLATLTLQFIIHAHKKGTHIREVEHAIMEVSTPSEGQSSTDP